MGAEGCLRISDVTLVLSVAEYNEAAAQHHMITTSLKRAAGARRRRHLVAALIAVSAALAVSACGSSGRSRTTTASNTVVAQATAFSKCMRAHGVPNFPDPGGPVPSSGSYSTMAGIVIPSSINMQSPAFETAQKSCQGLLSSVFSSQGKPPITASQKAALIAQAQCIREHGVPNYPDPKFPAGGGIAIQIGSGVNVDSPAFKQAQATCGAH